MKTTLDLPVDLVREVKIRAVQENSRPGEEMTPERVANVLLEDEAEAYRDAAPGEHNASE